MLDKVLDRAHKPETKFTSTRAFCERASTPARIVLDRQRRGLPLQLNREECKYDASQCISTPARPGSRCPAARPCWQLQTRRGTSRSRSLCRASTAGSPPAAQTPRYLLRRHPTYVNRVLGNTSAYQRNTPPREHCLHQERLQHGTCSSQQKGLHSFLHKHPKLHVFCRVFAHS